MGKARLRSFTASQLQGPGQHSWLVTGKRALGACAQLRPCQGHISGSAGLGVPCGTRVATTSGISRLRGVCSCHQSAWDPARCWRILMFGKAFVLRIVCLSSGPNSTALDGTRVGSLQKELCDLGNLMSLPSLSFPRGM